MTFSDEQKAIGDWLRKKQEFGLHPHTEVKWNDRALPLEQRRAFVPLLNNATGIAVLDDSSKQSAAGLFKLYPFVMERKPGEPRLILINPAVGFDKPVIAGTGISTAVVASRFNARESIGDLASEYGVEPRKIEEAIRWEQTTAANAA